MIPSSVFTFSKVLAYSQGGPLIHDPPASTSGGLDYRHIHATVWGLPDPSSFKDNLTM